MLDMVSLALWHHLNFTVFQAWLEAPQGNHAWRMHSDTLLTIRVYLEQQTLTFLAILSFGVHPAAKSYVNPLVTVLLNREMGWGCYSSWPE